MPCPRLGLPRDGSPDYKAAGGLELAYSDFVLAPSGTERGEIDPQLIPRMPAVWPINTLNLAICRPFRGVSEGTGTPTAWTTTWGLWADYAVFAPRGAENLSTHCRCGSKPSDEVVGKPSLGAGERRQMHPRGNGWGNELSKKGRWLTFVDAATRGALWIVGASLCLQTG